MTYRIESIRLGEEAMSVHIRLYESPTLKEIHDLILRLEKNFIIHKDIKDEILEYFLIDESDY